MTQNKKINKLIIYCVVLVLAGFLACIQPSLESGKFVVSVLFQVVILSLILYILLHFIYRLIIDIGYEIKDIFNIVLFILGFSVLITAFFYVYFSM